MTFNSTPETTEEMLELNTFQDRKYKVVSVHLTAIPTRCTQFVNHMDLKRSPVSTVEKFDF